MRMREEECPDCGARNIVDSGMCDIGTVRIRCVGCTGYFLPSVSSGNRTIENVTNAGVPITVWEPAARPSP